MKLPRQVEILLKPKLKEETYARLKKKVKELAQKLEEVPVGEEHKSLYLLSELQKAGSEWVEVYEWTDSELLEFVKTFSFESGNSEGIPVRKSVNCPLCGLTPLDNKYCQTCEKFVIFRHSGETPSYIQVTNELIITID